MKTVISIRHLALSGAACFALAAVAPVTAQPPANAQQAKAFDIAATTLAQAIPLFTAQSGVRVDVTADGMAGVRVHPVSGRFGPDEAFSRMVGGTGLSWHWTEQNVIVVSGMVSASSNDGKLFGAVRVEGAQASGAGGAVPLDGFGRGAGGNGSSDVTATEGSKSLTTNATTVATKAPTHFNDVPQTVSSITQEQIRQQQLTDVGSALNSVPGITLEYSAGGTPNILSRGFAVTDYVVDGGAPMLNPGGALDSGATSPGSRPFSSTPDLSEYDHVEVLKGSNALYGGASAPGGTVSLQRKRPLDHFQIVLNGHYGSWQDGRADLDVTGPVTDSGHTRVRVTAAYQDQDFFYDFASMKKLHLYGILEQDIDPDTVVRAGASYEYRDGGGISYSGLPRFGDGSDLKLPRSTNFSAPWAMLQGHDNEQFVQLDHQFGQKWKLSVSGTRTQNTADGFAPDYQGLGIAPNGSNFSHVGNYVSSTGATQYVADGHVAGTFTLFDLEQTLTFGADFQHVRQRYGQMEDLFTNNLNVFIYDPASLAAPPMPQQDTANTVLTSRSSSQQYGIYGNLSLQPIAGLHLNAGVRYSYFRISSDARNILRIPLGPFVFTSDTSSVDHLKYSHTFTPTGSIVYDLTRSLSVYVSYADTFQPDGPYVTTDGQLLPPERGRTVEGGIKYSGLHDTLHATAAVFDIVEHDVPLNVSIGTSPIGGCCYAAGAAIHNRGAEATISGEITKRWQVNAGYTYLHVDYNDVYRQFLGNNVTLTPISLTQQPKHQVKLWTTYQLPGALDGVQLSAGLRYESERLSIGSSCASLANNICTGTAPYRFSQGSYAVADVAVAYAVNAHVKLQVNVTNLTNKRYYATTGTASDYNVYGEPRKILGSVSVTY